MRTNVPIRGNQKRVIQCLLELFDIYWLPLFTAPEFPYLGYFLTQRLLRKIGAPGGINILSGEAYLTIHFGSTYNPSFPVNILFTTKERAERLYKNTLRICTDDELEAIVAIIQWCDELANIIRERLK